MKNIQELEKQYIINTYNRQPGLTPCLVRGEGSYVWDTGDKKYLDFLSGLAVNVLGHCHPAVVSAINEQAQQLIHTSNLYYSGPQAELAEILVENSMPGGKVFLANSGAEANEAAIKLARKNKPGRYKIITFEGSFHGRTLATVTATGQPKYQKPFAPLVEGFSYGIFNDLESVERLVDDQTAGIMIEPIQGEGGVYVADDSFIKGLKSLCDREGILLIFDEVQCGMGRSGKLWAFENYGVMPDLLTVAKGLGGGLPIGAMVVRDKFTDVLQPGDHASTFGGNPVVCNAALAVLRTLLEEGFLTGVVDKGVLLRQELEKIIDDHADLGYEYRGKGLICALELKKPEAKNIQGRCTAEGLLINAIGEHILRFLPPLTISKSEIENGLKTIRRIMVEFSA